MMNHTHLHKILEKFPTRHILVVGDFFLDNYLMIDPALSETSLETDLEAYQIVEIRHSPGAAGTVAANLRAMGVQVSAVGVTGRDGAGFDLRQDLQRIGVNLTGLLETDDRFTPTYTKPMLQSATGGPAQELNRFDVKNRHPLTAKIEVAVLAQLKQLVPTVDGVIIADQVQERNCGVITDSVRQLLTELAARHSHKPFIADSRTRIGEYAGVMIKPNIHEAELALRSLGREITPPSTAPLSKAGMYGQTLFKKNQQPVFITLGEQGILVVTNDETAHLPALPVQGPIDIVGAGDSVIAALTAALCAGATPKEATLVGNLAASITIQQLGTTGTASLTQLRQRLSQLLPEKG